MGAKLDRIGADLEKARRKRAEWDARVKDLERRYREEENSEIHEMVHAANLTPDELSELLRMFAADMAPKQMCIRDSPCTSALRSLWLISRWKLTNQSITGWDRSSQPYFLSRRKRIWHFSTAQ